MLNFADCGLGAHVCRGCRCVRAAGETRGGAVEKKLRPTSTSMSFEEGAATGLLADEG